MATFLNPGNEVFARILRSEYVDKTGLIGVINQSIDTPMSLTCASRPRRFGKSYAAQMLCAYYDKSCDSKSLFDGLKISRLPGFEEHLNRYNVLYADMAGIKILCDGFATLIPFLQKHITQELCEACPKIKPGQDILATLLEAASIQKTRFFMIIDEWDAPLREEGVNAREYLDLLRSLFKNSGVTGRVFAGVYMTGILPIRKEKSQSALSDFEEYTMLRPGAFAEYAGFTEEEVQSLCEMHSVSFPEMRRWYDGYELKKTGSVYNPNSVMKALRNEAFDTYWSQTSAADNLLDYIRHDVDGLRETILELMGGVEVEIDSSGYNNDLTYSTRDAALTLLVHLGYLAYDQDAKTVRIPNEEVRLEFARTIREDRNPETIRRVRESDQLIMDTISGNEQAVAAQIKRIHMETTNPLNANSEDSLRAVIQVAYFAYKDYFVKLEELPTGEGYADIVYLPKHGKGVPALLVELKWNESAEGAIRQIKDRQYVQAIEGYGGKMLLVGISYRKSNKKYTCKIKEWECSAKN